MTTQSAVSLKGLSYSVNGITILQQIDLDLPKGKFTGIIGPNGAGKTTLLKCLNGILQGNGEVLLDGQNIHSLKPKEIAGKVALMHQNTAISYPFPSLDVVLMGRYPHLGRFRSEGREDYRIALAHMSYTDTLKFKKKPANQLSGGERQRILFAKVLTQETDLILLDEPTASLDITHQEQIFKYARELCSGGKTVIAAVHDLKIAARYCDRLVLMKDGEVLAQGEPEAVLTRENLARAYGVNALVYRNKISGLLDFHIHEIHEGDARLRIHVIGGGGSASGVLRMLFEEGHTVSAGVFVPGDSDVQSAEIFGIRRIVGNPFSEIDDEACRENIGLVEEADITVLCNMPFGQQNLKNLQAAAHAKRLVMIEDEPPEARDFSGGEALLVYNRLKEQAVITTTARLHEVL